MKSTTNTSVSANQQPIPGVVSGVVFAVSNDGGKTGVAWRENIFDAFAYLDLQNKGGGDYAVVAVRKKPQ